jgi:carbonic anhydrase
VIPEFIFDKSIGDIFVVRVAGNVAMDASVLSSIEYAVEHLKVDLLLILGHTNCGAVISAEKSTDTSNELLNEIRKCFPLHDNHFLSNIMYQLDLLPKRSKIISNAIEEGTFSIIGALYNLKNGSVEFI